MSNALVPLAPAHREPAGMPIARRSSADFIAHLIATSTHAPQTCCRCRAAPGEASALYRAHDQAPPRVGQALCRSL